MIQTPESEVADIEQFTDEFEGSQIGRCLSPRDSQKKTWKQ